jgi:hypothetical protein
MELRRMERGVTEPSQLCTMGTSPLRNVKEILSDSNLCIVLSKPFILLHFEADHAMYLA